MYTPHNRFLDTIRNQKKNTRDNVLNSVFLKDTFMKTKDIILKKQKKYDLLNVTKGGQS